jgi:4-amino-4-deoxy-L-arabinose transferase-like glycosyltransferase
VRNRPPYLKQYILGILILAVALRIYGAMLHPSVPAYDAGDYHRLASGLVQGHGYINTAGNSTAWRPPAYPVFLAGIYELLGINAVRAVIVQAFLGGLTVLALIVLGLLILDWRTALIAGAVAAVYPAFVWLPRLLLSENLSLFLLLVSLCTVVMYLRTSRLVWMVVFGVLCALNTLVRGANLFLPLAVALGLIFIWWRKRSRNRDQLIAPLLVPLLVMSIAFALTLLPWTVRNYRAFHQFIPVATQDGVTLYAAYWPPQHNGKLIWGTLPGNEDPAIQAASQVGNEVAVSKYLHQVTMDRLKAQPSFFFRLIPSKLISLLVPLDWEIFPHAPGTTRSLNVGYLLILLPALWGFLTMLRERVRHQWVLWIIWAMVLLQSVFFYGSPRFRLPAELIAVLPAAVGVLKIWEFLKYKLKTVG